MELPTLLPHTKVEASVETRGSQPLLKLGAHASVSTADIVVMDGVVHGMDAVLLPPAADDNDAGAGREREASSVRSWVRKLGHSSAESVPVEQLMERLQSYVEKTE